MIFQKIYWLILPLLFHIFLPITAYSQINDTEEILDESAGYVTASSGSTGEENISGGFYFTPNPELSDNENKLIEAVFKQNDSLVLELLSKGINPNIKFISKTKNNIPIEVPILNIAIANNDKAVLNALLNHKDINLNITGSLSKQNISKYLNSINQDIHNSHIPEVLYASPLGFALIFNYLDVAEMLLQKGANPNISSNKLMPASSLALTSDAVMLLKKYNTDFNISDPLKYTALTSAVIRNDSQLLNSLLESGAIIDKKNAYGETPLYTAISYGYFDLARYLIDKGANINTPSTSEKITPIMATLSKNDFDAGFIRYILFKGAKLTDKDANGKTPIFYLNNFKENNNSNVKEILDILIENGADINAKDNNGNTLLHLYPEYYNIYSLYNPQINVQNINGDTPLHIAALNKDVTSILNGSPNKNIKNKKGKTALDIAYQQKDTESIEYLKMPQAEYLLMTGASLGNISMVNKALTGKPNLNNKIKGKYPLFYAAKGGSPEIFIKLIENGADIKLVPDLIYSIINSFNNDKNQNDRVKLVKLYIDNQLSKNWDKYNNILSELTKKQCFEGKGAGFIRDIIAYAFEKGADPMILDQDGRNLLHIVSSGIFDCYDLTLEFISKGIPVDVADNNGNLPLFNTAKTQNDKSMEFISMLNNSKADINITLGEDNNTMLMEAAKNGNKMIVLMLIARGADDTIKNKNNKTALELAQESLKNISKPNIDTKNTVYDNLKFIAEQFLYDKNTVAECRSGITEDCKKYYKPVEVITKP